MGKRRIVAETGAGQHGVATATVCALLGLQCVVYMGAEDMERQSLNVFRMRLLGAEVRSVDAGSRTLKDAINEAMRDWVATVADSYYLLGSVLGPHPYPLMVREFQSVIGQEARAQLLASEGRLPDAVVACIGGGSNAMGIFDAFIEDRAVRLIGVEAGGRGIIAANTRHGSPAAVPVFYRGPGVTYCRTPMATSTERIRSPPDSTTRRLARSTLRCTTAAVPNTPGWMTRRLLMRSNAWGAKKGSCRRSNRRTQSRTSCGSPPKWLRNRFWS